MSKYPLKLDRSKIKALYEQGCSPKEIALKLGCSRNTIANRLNEFGINKRTRSEAGFCRERRKWGS